MNFVSQFIVGALVALPLQVQAESSKCLLVSVDGYATEIPQEWLNTIPCLGVEKYKTEKFPKKKEILDILTTALEELHKRHHAPYQEKIDAWKNAFVKIDQHKWAELYQAAWHVGFTAQNKGLSELTNAQDMVADGLARAFALKIRNAKKGEIIDVEPFEKLVPGLWDRIGKQAKLLAKN